MSALATAILNGDTKKILEALNSGADIDSPNPIPYPHNNSYTPLQVAVAKGEIGIETVELLIMRGAKVDGTNSNTSTPLHLSSTPKKLRLLLQHKADLHYQDLAGRTPLHLAVLRGEMDRIKVMLEHKADPTLHDDDGETALGLARRWDLSDIAPLLEEQVEKLNPQN